MAGQEKVRLLQLSVKGLENDMAALKKACREEEASIQAEHLRAERAGEPAQAMRTRLDSVQEQLQRMREEHKERIRQCEEEVLDAQREFEAADEERNTLAAEEDGVRCTCDGLRAEIDRLRSRVSHWDEQRSKAALRFSAIRAKVDAAYDSVERGRACNEQLEQENVRRGALLDRVQVAEAGSKQAGQRLRDLRLVTQRYQREREALRHAERERDLAEELLHRLGGALGFQVPGAVKEPVLEAPPFPPPPPPPPPPQQDDARGE